MNFIEKNTKKVALFLCLATAGTAVTTVYAASNTTGWNDGIYTKEDGAVATGWLITEDGTYYCDKDGKPLTGWQEINGATYYFNVEGIKVSGEQIIDGHKYTFTRKGNLMTGWDTEKTAYFSKYGEKLTGIQVIDNKTFLFDEKGSITTGWRTIDGKKMYFTTNGSMATSKTEIKGKTYYFNSNGTITTGWVKKGKELFFYDKYGKMARGWTTIKDKDYYFNKKGEMLENTKYAGFTFDKHGVAEPIKEEEKEVEDKKFEEVDTDDTESTVSNIQANSGIASAALAQLGVSQDCTALVTNALAANGIYFHGWPADYLSLGTITSDPQPGDLIYYADGGMGMAHIAVYIGNGQAVHGGWNGNDTVIASAYVGSGPVFIRVN